MHGDWNNVCHVTMVWKDLLHNKMTPRTISPFSENPSGKIRGKESWWLTLPFSTSCDLWEGGHRHFAANEQRQQVTCGSYWVPFIAITQKVQQNIQKNFLLRKDQRLYFTYCICGYWDFPVSLMRFTVCFMKICGCIVIILPHDLSQLSS